MIEYRKLCSYLYFQYFILPFLTIIENLDTTDIEERFF